MLHAVHTALALKVLISIGDVSYLDAGRTVGVSLLLYALVQHKALQFIFTDPKFVK